MASRLSDGLVAAGLVSADNLRAAIARPHGAGEGLDRHHWPRVLSGQRRGDPVEEKILGLAPDDFRAQVSLVRLLWKTGKRREALQRLRRMEEQWARRGNKPYWRKTRRLSWLLAPSLSTTRAYFLSFFISPVPQSHAKKG